MKSLIVYSSKTGNTRKIAEAIYDILPHPKQIAPVEQAPAPDTFDFIAVGAWVDKGAPDRAAAEYMKKIQNKTVGIFLTLGAFPDSPHARQAMQNAKEMLGSCRIAAEFICQGKVDPVLIDWMNRLSQTDPEHPHAMNPERKARLEEAAKHPDEQDCRNAQKAFEGALVQRKHINLV